MLNSNRKAENGSCHVGALRRTGLRPCHGQRCRGSHGRSDRVSYKQRSWRLVGDANGSDEARRDHELGRSLNRIERNHAQGQGRTHRVQVHAERSDRRNSCAANGWQRGHQCQ